MIYDIRLQHFLSYEDESFEFAPGVNIIVGPNASGKTNLLEAVLVACVGRSYRAKDSDLVEHDQPWARIDAQTDTGPRIVKLETPEGILRLKKSVTVDGKPYLRLPLHKTQPVVLFEPNHLQLLHGSPELRREFLDNLLEQTIGGFGVLRRQYKRVLAQRNALLKQDHHVADQQLFAWNIRLSELGGQIAARRMDLINKINQRLRDLYQDLSTSKSQVLVSYVTSCEGANYSSQLLHKLEAGTSLDYQRGFTAYGPHRDDLDIKLNGYPASEAASRGEIRTLLLGLKIIEMQLVEEAHGQRPLLLLDDVFSELDGSRRKALTDYLSDHQTFITTTDADVVVQHFIDNCRIIPTMHT
jgi:DNA replication and repair protein RecF